METDLNIPSVSDDASSKASGPLSTTADSPLTSPSSTGLPTSPSCSPFSLRYPDLEGSAADCVKRAAAYAHATMKPDGHWLMELRANVHFTAEYVCLRLIVGPPLSDDDENAKLRRYFLSQQNGDGSWGLAPHWPGDVSTSTAGYFALKLLGLDVADVNMQKARAFILRAGGASRVGVTTQIMLALFGLVRWDDMAQVPAELMLMPKASPLNVFAFSYWSRVAAVAIMVLRHHQPVYPLPGGASTDFLDELHVNPADKALRYTPPLGKLWRNSEYARFAAHLLDKAGELAYEPWIKSSMVRKWSLKACVRYIVDHIEPSAGYGSFWNSNFTGLVALLCEGFKVEHPTVQCLLQAMNDSRWEDEKGGIRMQVTIGPVWDTCLMGLGLLECGAADSRMDLTVQWLKEHQILTTGGDYKSMRPSLPPGGWPFQYRNAWFPDNDDTLVALMVMVMHRPEEMGSVSVQRGLEWLLGMQCRDGGWGCFDADNRSQYLNLFPFGQGNEFFDISCPDITGRVVECFGLMLHSPAAHMLHPSLRARLREASARAIPYLAASQDPDTGGWGSRWHANYLNGTSSVLCALAYFRDGGDHQDGDYDEAVAAAAAALVDKPLAWLRAVQNPDGGWGEGLESYADHDQAGRGESTPTQTGWALLGLLSHVPATDEAIVRGVEHLIATQVPANAGAGDSESLEGEGGSVTWEQERYVSVGFPNILWLDYTSSRHGYPMMALGRFLHCLRTSCNKSESDLSFCLEN